MPTSRLRWLLTGAAASAMVAVAPVNAHGGAVVAMSSPMNISMSSAGGLVAQQGGSCERKARPACNRPGRRSTHK